MFVQMIRGPIGGDVDDLLEHWMDELRPGASGWLGITAGVTPDGQLVVLVRFATAAEAKRNSDRPEQGDWWAEMEKRFTGPVTFHDCDEVALVLDGGSDDAGFVQVIEAPGTAVSVTHYAEVSARLATAHRPDVLGGYVALARDGTMIDVVYFTSEDEAREYERRPLPADAEAEFEALMSAFGEPAFHDLPRPFLVSS